MKGGSLLLLCLLLGAPGIASAPQAPGEALRVEVGLVNVEVAVVDAEGRLLPDLGPENFRVREEGELQTIAHFAPVEAPVRIALLVEASPAVFLIRQDHLTAAYHLLAGLRPEDEVALLTYARAARVEADFTRDKRLMQHHLHTLGRYGLGMAEVNLLDAVANTVDWLSPPTARTAVLVIGTGLDSGSAIHPELLEERVGASQLTFFAVATGGLLRGEPETKSSKKRGASRGEQAVRLQSAFADADERLRALARASAGEAYFPRSAAELPEIYAGIAHRLRNLYSIGYYPKGRTRSGYRTISVELVDGEGTPLTLRDAKGNPIEYRVFARPGYFAPGE